ncbi:hypothetical protein D3C78_1975800 [compost metagenome]
MFSPPLIVSHVGALARTFLTVDFLDGVAQLAIEVAARRSATLQGDVVFAFTLVDVRPASGRC